MKKETAINTPAATDPKVENAAADSTETRIRYASKNEFDRALQKVRILHAGLIKRLAE